MKDLINLVYNIEKEKKEVEKLKKQAGLLNDLLKDCINVDDFIKKQKENEKMKKTNFEIIKELDKEDIIVHLDVADYVSKQEINKLDNITDIINHLNCIMYENEVLHDESEIIYYDRAFEVLRKYDPSFEKTLNIARDYGYDIEDLNSEILASLLMYKVMEMQYNEYLEVLKKALEQKESN